MTALFCAAAWAPKAHACGGTFCDRPGGAQSRPMTVDQSGENILFIRGEGYIEAHVQIRYQGDPERFAWLVPMPTVPEIAVGSQPLFDALLFDSMPVYGIRTTSVSCSGEVSESESSGCGASDASPTGATGVGSDRDEQMGMMMDPIGETVGTFDVTILQPTSADDIVQWLMDNEFELPARTSELIAPYVESGAVFAAIRLVPGAGVQEIHPIVFRYPGERPMIPIQLTAVAATDDMRVRTFFLGENRTVPSNFRHVTLNDARLSWPTFASNYENVVSQAVDATGDGLGFVTEYAGASSIVDDADVLHEEWDAEAFEGLDPIEAVEELKAQGQLDCGSSLCWFPHPLVLPLVQRYIPAPLGVRESDFYACVECNRDRVDMEAWDAAAFAADYAERVIEPGRHARQLLRDNGYLTRMLTTISPEEMTSDPAFHERPDLEMVSREHWAQRTRRCGEATVMRLPDGRRVTEDTFLDWVGNQPSMPAAERIEMFGLEAEVALVAEFSGEIDLVVDDWNDDHADSAPAGGASTSGRSSGGSSSGRARGCNVNSGVVQQTWLFALCLLWLAHRRRKPLPAQRGELRRP